MMHDQGLFCVHARQRHAPPLARRRATDGSRMLKDGRVRQVYGDVRCDGIIILCSVLMQVTAFMLVQDVKYSFRLKLLALHLDVKVLRALPPTLQNESMLTVGFRASETREWCLRAAVAAMYASTRILKCMTALRHAMAS